MVTLLTDPIPLHCTPSRVEGTVVVLGASFEQLPLIRTIRGKGLRALALDHNPQAHAFADSDDHAFVSTRDVDAIVQFCRSYRKKHRIVGVTTMASDIPHILAAVGNALDLPAVSLETGKLATQKYLMKERFREAGVPVPWFRYVDNPRQLESVAKHRDYQIVMKPVDATGSWGVYKPRPTDDLDELFAKTASVGKVGRVMVEEYVPGVQVSTQSVLLEHTSYTPGVGYRNYEQLDTFLPRITQNGCEVPGMLTPEQIAACAELTVCAGRALGITRGDAKGDLVIHPDRGPMVIEIAARLSAGNFTDTLVPLATGVNVIDAAVNVAVGEDPDPAVLVPKNGKAAATRYFFPEPGTLKRIDGLNAAVEKPWLRMLRINVEPNEAVEMPIHAGRYAGAFAVEGTTPGQVRQRIREIYDTMCFVTEPPN